MTMMLHFVAAAFCLSTVQARAAPPLNNLVTQGEGFGGNSLHTKDQTPFFNDPENTNLITGIEESSSVQFQAQPSVGVPLPNNQQGYLLPRPARVNSGQGLQGGIPLPNNFNTAGPTNTFSVGVSLPNPNQFPQNSNDLGVPLPDIVNVRTGNGQSSGVPIPQNADNLGVSLQSPNQGFNVGIPLPTSSGAAQSFANQGSGVPLPAGDGTSFLRSSDNLVSSNNFGIPLPSQDIAASSGSFDTGVSMQSNLGTFQGGVPLPSQVNFPSPTVSGGVPLPSEGVFSTGGSSLPAAQGVPLPGSSFASPVSSPGVPLPSSEPRFIGESFGVPIPTGKVTLSSPTITGSPGVPLPTRSTGSSNQDIRQDVGVDLPGFDQLSHSVGASLSANAEGTVVVPESNPTGVAPTPSNNVSPETSIGIPIPTQAQDQLTTVTTDPDQNVNLLASMLNILVQSGVGEQDAAEKIPEILTQLGLTPSSVGPAVAAPQQPLLIEIDGEGNLSGDRDDVQDLTIGELLTGINGQNGIVVLPMSSVPGASSGSAAGVPLPSFGDSSSLGASAGTSGDSSAGSSLGVSVGVPIPSAGDTSAGSSLGVSVGVPIPSGGGSSSGSSVDVSVGVPIPVSGDTSSGSSIGVSVGVPIPSAGDSNLGGSVGVSVDVPVSTSGASIGVLIPPTDDAGSDTASVDTPSVLGVESDTGSVSVSVDVTTQPPRTTTRRSRRTTTTPTPYFRDYLSDLLYSKGQLFGTLLGGFIDYGRIAYDVYQENFKNSEFSVLPYSS